MPLTATAINNNSMAPGIAAEVYVPDQLIAGIVPLVTDNVTIVSGAGVIKRGTVLGKITASGKYTTSLTASADGSQSAAVVAADTVDATSADQVCGVYLSGEFNANAMTLGTGWTVATVTAALRSLGIYVKAISSDLTNTAAT